MKYMTNNNKDVPSDLYEQRRQESLKLQYDWYKHLTTLSTGGILIIAALSQSVFSGTEGKGALIGSVIALAFSLMSSANAMLATAYDIRQPFSEKKQVTIGSLILGSSHFAAFSLFVLGMFLFLVYAVTNG